MKKLFAKAYVKEVKSDGIITGAIASTENQDRDGEQLATTGWELDNFLRNPLLLWGHDAHELPIGKVLNIRVDGNKLIFDAQFAIKENDFAEKVWNMVKGGFLNAFSVGFIPKERDGDRFTRQELLEISLVNVPANAEALMSREFKAFQEDVDGIEKSAIPFKAQPLAPKDAAWDGIAETKKATTEELKAMSAWFDSENAESKTSYKFTHHQFEGTMTVWRGVVAAMANLLGSGGVSIPEEDRKAVYNHLKKHYAEFEEEAPEFRSLEQIEKKKIEVDGEHYAVFDEALSAIEAAKQSLLAVKAKSKAIKGVAKVDKSKADKHKMLVHALRRVDKNIEHTLRQLTKS